MNRNSWKAQLPEFAVKEYITGFDNIASEFAKKIEQEYIRKNREYWMHPVIEYLTTYGMADVFELEQIPNPSLEYTHFTPNAILINQELEKLCVNSEKKKILEKVKLEKMSLRKIHPQLGNDVGEEYLNAYKIKKEYFTLNMDQSDKLVTHEISADTMGII